MDLGLEGKVALVMAASKGLGRAVATELAREGASVVISSRDEGPLAETAADIAEETGAEVEPRAADITRAEDVQALFSHTTDRFGGLDVLVNNTGGPPAGTFDDFDDEGWQAGFELVLLSLIRVDGQGAPPDARARRRAHRQHRVLVHQAAHREPHSLQHFPRGDIRPREEPGHRARPGRHPRKHHRSRPHLHRALSIDG